jgi:cytochrome c oxidase cbb3-type subunit I/II
MMQLAFDENGYLAHRDWMEIVRASVPFYWIRFAGGLLFLTGMVLCAINVWRTLANAKPVEDDVVAAPALLPDQDKAAQVAEAMTRPADLAGRTDALHALIERWPTLLIVLSALAVSVGGMCQIVPVLIKGAYTPPNPAYTPYTALELTGRDIYIREGCNGCHTQMVRTLRAETDRYGGKFTQFDEGRYDRPFLWGSKRTGPDLAREGVLRPLASWHYFHFQRPSAMAAGSIMPNYSWLNDDDMDLSTVRRKLQVLSGDPLGTPYSAKQVENAEADARAQAKLIADELRKEPRLAEAKDLDKKEVIALIAYIQRLGMDREKADSLQPAPAAAVVPPAAPAVAGGKP